MRIGAVLLAAGAGSRFGGDKLLADVAGRPMAALAMDKLLEAGCSRIAAVVSDERTACLARGRGMEVIVNPQPQLGISGSIELGVRAMKDMDAVLLAVADQPRLSTESICALLEGFMTGRHGMACLMDETHAGNPAVFAARYFDELMALEGDRGGKVLLKRYAGDILKVRCLSDGELEDADTQAVLARMLRQSEMG